MDTLAIKIRLSTKYTLFQVNLLTNTPSLQLPSSLFLILYALLSGYQLGLPVKEK